MAIKYRLPATREEAVSSGWAMFYDGVECQSGHVAPKYAIDGVCSRCRDEQMTGSEEEVRRALHSRRIKISRIRRRDKEGK